MRRWQKIALVAYWLAAPAAVVGFSQIIGGLPFTLTNGTVADATQVMADFNQIVNNTNANAAKNGTNSDITALTALVTPLTPAQGGTTAYAAANTSGGSANAQTLAVTVPSTYVLTKNYLVTFVPGATNTTAMTLNVNGTGAKNVFKQSTSGPIALIGGEVVINQLTTVAYDGTQFVLLEKPSTPGIETSLASAATTDLGTIPSHVVLVTGTTGITSFGSTAQTDAPIYYIRFAGTLTITWDATAMRLPGNADLTTSIGDAAIAEYIGTGNWQIIAYQRRTVGPFGAFPTVQRLAAGSGTYTPTAGTTKIKVHMQAAGGGGGATVTNAGANGSANSSFGSWTANVGQAGAAGGAGGANGGNGGISGTDVSNATNTLITRIPGQRGGDAPSPAAGTAVPSGPGGNAHYGQGGAGIRGSQAGVTGVIYGGGGSGGGGAAAVNSGAGGGGGEYVEFWVNSPAATSYVVGSGGAGGAAGTNAGGNGAAGITVIEEYYQ